MRPGRDAAGRRRSCRPRRPRRCSAARRLLESAADPAARGRAPAHHHRLRRHRQDTLLDRAVPSPSRPVSRRRGIRLAWRSVTAASDVLPTVATRARHRRGARPLGARRALPPSSATAECCWCSTISSRSSMPPEDIAALVARCPLAAGDRDEPRAAQGRRGIGVRPAAAGAAGGGRDVARALWRNARRSRCSSSEPRR